MSSEQNKLFRILAGNARSYSTVAAVKRSSDQQEFWATGADARRQDGQGVQFIFWDRAEDGKHRYRKVFDLPQRDENGVERYKDDPAFVGVVDSVAHPERGQALEKWFATHTPEGVATHNAEDKRLEESHASKVVQQQFSKEKTSTRSQ